MPGSTPNIAQKISPAVCTSMLLWLSIYSGSTASTAQHSTAQRNQPCTKQRSNYVPIRARQRKQADRVGESQQKKIRTCTQVFPPVCYIECTVSRFLGFRRHSIPSRPNEPRVFPSPASSRSNQPRAFTSHSIRVLTTP